MTLDSRFSTLDSASRVLLDSGTAYSKLYRLDSGLYEAVPNRALKALIAGIPDGLAVGPRDDLRPGPAPMPGGQEALGGVPPGPPRLGRSGLAMPDGAPAPNHKGNTHALTVVAATGHNASRFSSRVLNELLALAYGGLELVAEDDFVLVDCGARDIKMVRVGGRRVQEMNWNTECGAFCGQTVDLLLGHFGLRAESIAPATRPLAVTCGVLGMTQLFDLIAADVAPEEALARFVRGIAENVHRFAGRPDRFYLSGGFCENRLFLDSLECEVLPLGRFVLLEGLRAELARSEPEVCGTAG